MNIYFSKRPKLKGSSYDEVVVLARAEYRLRKHATRRQPYIRSTYFNKDKIFLALFWEHLSQKHRRDKMYRLKLYVAAIDLILRSTCQPRIIKGSRANLYRFYGQTADGEYFCVQVKEDIQSKRKDFMSVFPLKRMPK